MKLPCDRREPHRRRDEIRRRPSSSSGTRSCPGKVQDENARYLIGELRRLGVSLRRIEVVPDVVGEIAAQGAGPGRRRRPPVHLRGRRTDPRRRDAGGRGRGLRDAARPQRGARTAAAERLRHRACTNATCGWPTSRSAPASSTAPAARGRPGRWWSSATSGFSPACRRFSAASSRRCASSSGRRRFTGARSTPGPAKGRLPARSTRRWPPFPGVEVGSYPHLDAADYRVKITLDGRDAAAVDRALAFLAARLGRPCASSKDSE